MKINKVFWGLLLIILGVVGIFNRMFGINIISIRNLWSLFILLPGLCFEYSYFYTKRNPGLLVPGGILTTIGVLFIFETFTGWRFAGYTWPIYILAVAIGLFQLYLFGGRQKALLIPVGILTFIAAICFFGITFGNLIHIIGKTIIVPIILLLIGVYILFKKD